MLSRRLIATSSLFSALLLTTIGCSDSNAPESEATTNIPAPEVPQAGDEPSAADTAADTSASKAADEPSKDAFLAAAQKGVNLPGSDADMKDPPPFVSTPENPGPTGPEFSDPTEPQTGVDPAWREKWETSFEKAKAMAQAETKDILMNFTGSDWCGWCIQLGKEVFRHQAFADYAQKNFVLVELDFPESFELDESLKQQNVALKAQFGVSGFPSILLVDAQGRAYAQTGYEPGGPSRYIEHLETLKGYRQTRDEAFAAAEQLAGVEKAKKLDEGLAALQPSLVFASYGEIVEQIIALDADGSAELKAKYQMGRAEQQLQEIVNNANATGDWDTVLADLDKFITDYAAYDELALQAQMLQLQIFRIAKRDDDLLKLADHMLTDDTLPKQAKLQIHVSKLAVLDAADRLDDALLVVDAILTEFADQKEMRINLLMTKASFLARLGQKDAAKTVIQSVRDIASPSLLPQIDEFEKTVLDTPENEETSSAKPSGDAAAKQ